MAAGAHYPFLSSAQADLSIGARIDIAIGHGDGGGTQIALEAPLRLSWFVTPHLALHGEVGLVLALIPDEGGTIAPPGQSPIPAKATGINLGATGLSGGAGFTYIF